MMELSKPIGEPAKSEREVKHVITADSDDETERKVVTREAKKVLLISCIMLMKTIF